MPEAASTSAPTGSPLEQYLLLAKSAKGAAAVSLIQQVLEAPNVHVFGELLDNPNIMELAGTQHAAHLELLQLFAFGTYKDYDATKYPIELAPARRRTRYS